LAEKAEFITSYQLLDSASFRSIQLPYLAMQQADYSCPFLTLETIQYKDAILAVAASHEISLAMSNVPEYTRVTDHLNKPVRLTLSPYCYRQPSPEYTIGKRCH